MSWSLVFFSSSSSSFSSSSQSNTYCTHAHLFLLFNHPVLKPVAFSDWLWWIKIARALLPRSTPRANSITRSVDDGVIRTKPRHRRKKKFFFLTFSFLTILQVFSSSTLDGVCNHCVLTFFSAQRTCHDESASVVDSAIIHLSLHYNCHRRLS